MYELHGSTLRNYCTRCGKFSPVSFVRDAAGVGDGVPRCDECGGIVKPDVVLYEEGLDEETMENAVHAIRGPTPLVSAAQVWPSTRRRVCCATFRGDNLVVINKQPTRRTPWPICIHAPIGRAGP